MKKNFFLVFVTAGALLCSISCSKQDLTEETQLTEGPETTMATASTSSRVFFEGVNGHPMNQAPYTYTSPEAQINLIKSLGMNVYRIDLPVNSKGEVNVPHRLDRLKKAADAAGVTLLPMIATPNLENFKYDEGYYYRKGHALGSKFAKLYGEYFTYYNIGNELDNKCILSSSKAGDKAAHYDIKKFRRIAACLRGMNDGIKIYDKTAKTMINASWMHYRYLSMIEDLGIRFDIVAYHWYDEMEQLAKQSYNIDDFTKFLSSKFKKPIWFTEIGVRDNTGTGSRSVQYQTSFFNSFITKCRNNPQVQAVIIYELFNEPHLSYVQEQHYGIYKWLSLYTSYAPKPFAAERLKSLAQ